jgi:hypothetical protein
MTTVTTTASDAAGNPASQTFSVTVVLAPVSYHSWAADQFTTDDLADPAISGPNASPAGDGLSNLLKYALGLPAKTPSTTGITFGRSNESWIFTYRRPADRPDLIYNVEVTSDPGSGSWSGSGVVHQRIVAGDMEAWQGLYTPDVSARRLYFRLNVQKP